MAGCEDVKDTVRVQKINGNGSLVVLIPKRIRELLGIKQGDSLDVFAVPDGGVYYRPTRGEALEVSKRLKEGPPSSAGQGVGCR